MFLDINIKDIQRKSVFEYIASTIESKFPDASEDAEKIRNAKDRKEVKSIFSEYYEGWRYDGVCFQFEDIDNILYWIDQEVELYKKDMEHKKWLTWLADRGLTPGKVKITRKK